MQADRRQEREALPIPEARNLLKLTPGLTSVLPTIRILKSFNQMGSKNEPKETSDA
jgi:hypothetical protein